MSKILEEKKNEKKSSPDSEIMKAVHRTGVKPVEVKEPFDKSGMFSGRHHNGVDGVVTKFTTKSGVATVSGVPITSDGQNDVDGSGRDYREVVEVRPHMIPTEVGKKPTRYARKQRGKSPGSYRQAQDMKHYGKKAPWAELQTQCHAFQRDGKTRCGAQSRKGSKFCGLPEHSTAKQGIPDYAAEFKAEAEADTYQDDEGPLPESLQRPLLWVWGNFYTPFSWMVVWVFSVMMSAKGIFGQAIASPQLLMRYTTQSVACKWKWKQTIAILSQSMGRKTPLLSVDQVSQVLGTHEQTRRTRRVDDPFLKERIAKGTATRNDKGKWTGRNGAKWFKEATKQWTSLTDKVWDANCLKAYLDPKGINARCEGLAELVKEDGTPNMSAAKRKFGKQLISLSEIKKASGKIPAYFKTPNYEFNIAKPTTMKIMISETKSHEYTKDKFVEKYIKLKAERFALKYDVFYLVDEKARRPRGTKKGLQWVDDPVIIQCAIYADGEGKDARAKMFLGLGRKTKSGHMTGPFESRFLRTRGASQFAHVWDADDKLDVMELKPKRSNKRAEDSIIKRLKAGETLNNWDDLLQLQRT
jgi:hypothetical protein